MSSYAGAPSPSERARPPWPALCCLAACMACSGTSAAGGDPTAASVGLAPAPYGADWSLRRVTYVAVPPIFGAEGAQASFEEPAPLAPDPDTRVWFEGRDVVRRAEAGETEPPSVDLHASIADLVVHPVGGIVVLTHQSGDYELRSLDPATLTARWTVEGLRGAPLVLTSSHAYVATEHDDARYFTEVDLASGSTGREFTLTGRVMSELMQHGSLVAFFAFDEQHEVAQGQSTLVLERIDLETWTRRSLDVHAEVVHHARLGATRVLAPDGTTTAFAAIHGGAHGELLWIDASSGEASVRPFAEDHGYDDYALVQLGPSVLTSARNRLHVFAASTGEHAGTLSFPSRLTSMTRRDQGVRLELEARQAYLLRPGSPASAPAESLRRWRAAPWRDGDATLVHDGDPATSWRFLGRQGSVEFVFEAPVIVPAFTLTSPPRTDGDTDARATRATATYHLTDYGDVSHRRTQVRVGLDVTSTEAQPLVEDAHVARRVVFELTCECRREPRGPCEGCRVGEIGW